MTVEECELLRFLLNREVRKRIAQIEAFAAVARCGCGECSTLLFGTDLSAEPLMGRSFSEIASYHGPNVDRIAVAVSLLKVMTIL